MEVIADILRLGEAGKTEIMYSANMSYRQLQKYLTFLVQQGFLERRVVPNPGVKYRTTRKGHRLLKSIDTMLDVLGSQG
ncbi:winged helix-turn-helix domain-containing protein [Chloroflexota bacterium]